MFHKEFYPTPKNVAIQMCNGYEDSRYILDPSAGKGDLVQPLIGHRRNVYGIEQSIELCGILKEKGIRVLGNDFFDYDGTERFDVVIMNPPFSNGVDHLLHAWNICKGADVVCLLPTNTVRNGRTEKQRLISSIIEDFGSIEDIGAVFMSDAERSANVDVSIVRLKRKKAERFHDFSFEAEEENGEDNDVTDQSSPGLVKRNRVKQVVKQYQDTMDGFDALFEAAAKIRRSIGTLVPTHHIDSALSSVVSGNAYTVARGDFNTLIKSECWNSIFKEGKFSQMISSAVTTDFDAFLKHNRNMAFSEENIASVFRSLFESRDDIVNQAFEDAFDYLTKYHHENREHIEGWKTNERWKVKKKFILPSIVGYDGRWSGSWSFYHSRMDRMKDVDIAMCYLTGKSIDDIVTISDAIYSKIWERPAPSKLVLESEFFDIVCHKKGTGHFTFKDDSLWKRFNVKVCAGKKWLPGKD